MTARPLVVAFDCDGVLINTIYQFLVFQFPQETHDQILSRFNALENYDDVTKKYGLDALFLWLETHAERLYPVTNALNVLVRLRRNARVVCVTAPPPLKAPCTRYERRRRRWLVDVAGFAEHDIIFAPSGAKPLIDCDVFVDDHYQTVADWNAGHRQGFLIDLPWTRAEHMRQGPHKVIGLHELHKVADYVEKVLAK